VGFTNDEVGQIIRRDETRPGTAPSYQTGSPHEVWYRFAGRQLGYTGNNGSNDMGTSASIQERQIAAPTPGNAGTFRNGSTYGISYADFAQSYDPLNSYAQGSGSGTYTVRSGDTLQSIAQSIYGDSNLWYKIAEANGLSAGVSLIEGRTLMLPGGVAKNSHNADTFRPYNPAEAIGDLSPTNAKPPKKPKCGGFV
jgi:LysM repeat protein